MRSRTQMHSTAPWLRPYRPAVGAAARRRSVRRTKGAYRAQSVRRDRENQGFPPCFEHALGDLDLIRELPYGQRWLAAAPQAGQMAASDYAFSVPQIHSYAEGGVHRWKAVNRESDLSCLGRPVDAQGSCRDAVGFRCCSSGSH